MKEASLPNNDYLPNPEQPRFSRTQELQFELIKQASHNSFDGEWVVDTLKANPDIWDAAMIGNFETSNFLTPLRDMRQGFFNADTLAILTTKDREPFVEEMIQMWEPDEVRWLTNKQTAKALGESHPRDKRVVLAWWS